MAATLDLRGVQVEPVSVIDRYGNEWALHDGLPLRTAVTMMELAPAFESGNLTAPEVEKTIDAVLAVFRRENADVDREKLLDCFDLDDLIKVIVFLATRAEERESPGPEAGMLQGPQMMQAPEEAKILKRKR